MRKSKVLLCALFCFGLGILSLVFSTGCETERIVLVDRSGCLSCHRPLKANGRAHGIERAHPLVKGRELTCVMCHGGDAKARKQSKAHVSPGRNATAFLRNLTIGELDSVDKAYLRFVNPGDFRVAKDTCGRSDCHQSIFDKIKTNPMSTFSGELGVARYRAGIQNSGGSVKAIYDVRDLNFIFGKVPGTVGALSKMTEPRVPKDLLHIGPYQDLYLTKACMRCHLWSFGDNKFPGDFRSSGCTACHMNYKNDGRSRSDDPTVVKDSPPHPAKHILTTKVTTEQCTHCHYRGGRIGINFQGYREGAGAGFNPPKAGFLGKALHGHDANFYITDEDTSNNRDETPPDVHFQAGMSCIDCHTSRGVHGDGHIYSSSSLAVDIRCVDCHGTIKKEATLVTKRGTRLKHLSRDAKGVVWLTTKITGKRLKVIQIKKSVENARPQSYLHRLMGRDSKGFSHMDTIACSTCHSAWIPNCYGCHIKVDMRKLQRSLISGFSSPGKITGGRKWVTVDDMILMINIQGQISLSMPAERMFFTAIDGTGKKVINKQVRRGPQGQIGHGHRAFSPHTIRKWSPFMGCARCHLREDGKNKTKIDLAVGFGTDRFLETDGNGKTWRLDQVQDRNFKPVVLIGHNEPKKSTPLTAAIVKRMLSFKLKQPYCLSDTVKTTSFSKVTETIFTPSCVTGCHSDKVQLGGLNLSSKAAWNALVNKKSVVDSNKLLVVPGKPEDSYLLQKLIAEGKRVGRRMPTNGNYLWDCQVELLRQWIRDGAKNN